MFTVGNMSLNDMPVAVLPNKLRKHSRNGESQGNLNIRSYKDKKLCARA